MIRLRIASMQDAETILADLSAITLEDVEAHGMTDEQVRASLERYFSEGSVHTMLDDDEPLCIAGIALTADQWICWLLAREGFWSVRPSIWRILRRYAQTVLPIVGEPIHSYSGSSHQRLTEWMAALGFEEAGQVGRFRHFIFGG